MRRSAHPRRAPSHAPGPTTRARLVRAAGPTAFTAVVIFYVALKSYQFHLSDSDENIYFYMAVRSAFGGLTPYRDYFFAHPPLHLGLAVLALKLVATFRGAPALLDPSAWADGGVALVTVKSIGIVAGVVGGLCVYRAVGRVSGALEAFLAGTLFLLSPDVLHSFFTGIAEALMLAALGLERVVAGRDRQAGLAFAAGCLVAMYVAPCGLAVWLVLLPTARRRAFTLALWTAAPLLLVHGLWLLWAGRAYWEAVFVYHLHKPKLAEGILPHELLLLLRKSSLLVAAVPAALAALWRGGPRATFARARLADEPRVQLAAFALTSLAATLAFVAATRAIFHYYFVMLLFGLAPLAGLAYGELLRRLVRWLRALRTPGPVPPVRAFGLVAVLLAWPLAGAALARAPFARRAQLPDEAVGHAAPRVWRSSPMLGPLDGAVHALLWRDEEILGEGYPIWTRFLWDASQTFEMAEPFAAFARRGLPPQATLFGDPTLVDAVALLSGRRVALDEADTNFMRFRSGITPSDSFIARLRAAPPELVLFSVGEYLTMDDAFHRWLERDYESNLANDRDGIVYTVMRPLHAARR